MSWLEEYKNELQEISEYDILKFTDLCNLLLKTERQFTPSVFHLPDEKQIIEINNSLNQYQNEYLNNLVHFLTLSTIPDNNFLKQNRSKIYDAISRYRWTLISYIANLKNNLPMQKELYPRFIDLQYKLLLLLTNENGSPISSRNDIRAAINATCPDLLAVIALNAESCLPPQIDKYIDDLEEFRHDLALYRTPFVSTIEKKQQNAHRLQSFLTRMICTMQNFKKDFSGDVKKTTQRLGITIEELNLLSMQELRQLAASNTDLHSIMAARVVDILLEELDDALEKINDFIACTSPLVSFVSNSVFFCHSNHRKNTNQSHSISGHLRNIIRTTDNLNIAINTFEKLLILSPKQISPKETARVISIFSSHTNTFFGDLGKRMSEIRQDFNATPEGKTTPSAQKKYFLLSILCATAVAIAYLLVTTLPHDILEYGSLGIALIIGLAFIIFGIIHFGFLMGIFLGYVAAALLFNLGIPALAIGCIIFLFKGLKLSFKKEKNRAAYLKDKKKCIREPMEYIRFLQKQLEQVDAGIDLSAIKQYYAGAAKFLTHYQKYK